MRVTDLFLALPGALVAIAIVAALGSGLVNTLIGVAIVWWPYYARIVRGEVKALAARPHVEAARLAGVGRPRILTRHLLPGVVPTAVVTASLDVGNVVLLLAALSFLGLGSAGARPRARRRHRPRTEPAAQSVVGARHPGHRGAAAEPGRQPRRRRHPQPHPGAEVTTMLAFLTRRLSAAVLILLILSLVIFVLQHVSPGDPARAYVGANASPATVAAERQRLGLNDPFFTQYFHYLGGLFTGDLGRSLRTRQPVTADLATYLPATAELVVTAFLIALILAALYALSGALRWPGAVARPRRAAAVGDGAAVPAGARRHHRVLRPTRVAARPGASGTSRIPGPTGMQALDTLLHGQTDAFVDALQHLALPAVVLSIAPAVAIGRVLRSSLQGVLGVDYVRTARSKGLTERQVVAHHVVRNAIGPALSMAGLQLGFMFAGVVVVEQVFSWPGIGNYLAAVDPGRRLPGDRRGHARAGCHLRPVQRRRRPAAGRRRPEDRRRMSHHRNTVSHPPKGDPS